MRFCKRCGKSVDPDFYLKSGGLCGTCLADDGTSITTEAFSTLPEIKTSPLSVHVDWEDMISRHMGDKAAAFAELGELKDFLA